MKRRDFYRSYAFLPNETIFSSSSLCPSITWLTWFSQPQNRFSLSQLLPKLKEKNVFLTRHWFSWFFVEKCCMMMANKITFFLECDRRVVLCRRAVIGRSAFRSRSNIFAKLCWENKKKERIGTILYRRRKSSLKPFKSRRLFLYLLIGANNY